MSLGSPASLLSSLPPSSVCLALEQEEGARQGHWPEVEPSGLRQEVLHP